MRKDITVFISVLFIAAGCSTSNWQKPSATAPGFALAAAQQVVETPPPAEEEPQPETAPVVEQNQQQPTAPKKQETPPPTAVAPAAPTQAAPTPEKPLEPVIGSDGRLLHPWYTLPAITPVPEGPHPKWFNESLKFKIGWSFVTAGEADLITGKMVDIGHTKAYVVEAYAQSFSVIDKLFKVRDINVSWIAADLTRSLGFWQSVREGGYMRDEVITFDFKNNTYTLHKQDNKKRLSTKVIPFKGETIWDMLSSMYFVRTKPLPVKGEVFFDIVNAQEQYPLKVIVHGKETVKVKAGKFNCILVEPVISGEGIFVSKGKSLKVWLTDDEYRMPVKMSVEVMIGSVYAELVSYTRGK